MKSLASIAVLLVLIAQVVSATDLCPTRSLEDTSVSIDTTDTYMAIGCSMNNGVTFDIALPENESTTYVTVENSTILSYSLSINILVNIDSQAPFAIDIKNNLFNLNAYLFVGGILSMNSSLTIQGNTMSANDVNWDIINLIVIDRLTLYANASLNIVNNVLNVSNQNADYTDPIYFYNIYLEPFSSVNILRNTITATGMIRGSLIYIFDSSYAENSTWNVMNNTLMSTSTYTVAAYDAGGDGDSSAVYVFGNNFVNITNTVESVGSALYFRYSSLFLLSVEDNQIYYNVENAIYFNSIDRLSGLSISGNAIHSTNGTLASPVIMVDHFYILPNATYVLNNNKVTATSVTATDAPLLHVDDIRFMYYVPDNTTKIHYCGNTLPWSNEPTAEQLFSSELLDYVVASCERTSSPATSSTSAQTSADTSAQTSPETSAENSTESTATSSAVASSSPLRSFSGSALGIVFSVVVAQLLL